MARESERMIAGGRGYDASGALSGREAEKGIARASLLEAARELLEVAFAENRHARELAEWRGVRARRETQTAGKALLRLLNGFESEGVGGHGKIKNPELVKPGVLEKTM